MWSPKERAAGSFVIIFTLLKIMAAIGDDMAKTYSYIRESGLCVPQLPCSSDAHNSTESDTPDYCKAIIVCDSNAIYDYYIENVTTFATASVAPPIDTSSKGCRKASVGGSARVVYDSQDFSRSIGDEDIGAIILANHVEIDLEAPADFSTLGFPMIRRPLAILGGCVDPPTTGDFSLELRDGMCIIDGKNISNLFDVSNSESASLTLFNVRLQNAYIPTYVDGAPNLRYGGSALQMAKGGSAFFLQVDIVNNIGVWGGAISISGQSSGTKFVCAKCRFQENYSVTVGAGCVHMVDRVQATFIETSFDHCVAGNNYSLPEQAGAWGGAVHLFGEQDLEGLYAYFKNCTFSNNTQYGAGKMHQSMLDGYKKAHEKYVDVFLFCKDCHIAFDVEDDEDDPSQNEIDPTQIRKVPIWGGNPNSTIFSQSEVIYPQIRTWYIPSLLSYGSETINSTVPGNEMPGEILDLNITLMADTFERLCPGKDRSGKPDYSSLMKAFFISKMSPGDIDIVNYKGEVCTSLPERQHMTSNENCSLNFSLDSTRYENTQLGLPEAWYFNIVDIANDPKISGSKSHHTAVILPIAIALPVALVAVIAFVRFKKKKKSGKGKEVDLEMPLVSSSKSNSELDAKKPWKPAQSLMAKLKDALIPYGDIKRKQSLGRGAQGEVFIGYWDTTIVALKQQFLQHMIDEEVTMNKNIEREVDMMKELRHPHIVQFFGLSVSGPYVYIVMEYMSRRSLKELLVSAKKALENPEEALENPEEILDPKRLLNIAYQISAGMQHLHQSGILHRDLKPGNIFISKDFVAKVGDFGLSRHVTGPDLSASSLVGTPGYMAPEVSKGIPYSYAADVWSFGSLLHELITGKHYYEDYSMPDQILTAVHQRNEVPRIKCDVKGWSPSVLELVEKCCSPDPDSRPSFKTIRTILHGELQSSSGEIQNPTGNLASSSA